MIHLNFKRIRIQVISLTKQNFQIFCLIFLAHFYAKLDEPFRNKEISIIRIQEAKIFRIQLTDPGPKHCCTAYIYISDYK